MTVQVIAQARLPEDFERDIEGLKAKRILATIKDYLRKTEPSLLGNSIFSSKSCMVWSRCLILVLYNQIRQQNFYNKSSQMALHITGLQETDKPSIIYKGLPVSAQDAKYVYIMR